MAISSKTTSTKQTQIRILLLYHTIRNQSSAPTDITVCTLPAGDAHLVALVAACVVAELVIAGPTERCARGVVVVGRALDAYADT